MFEKYQPEQNFSKIEHLKKGIRPIIACIGTPDQFDNFFSEEQIDYNEKNFCNVAFYDEPEDLVKKGFKNAGHYSYVISSVNSFDKFSGNFKNCTGLVATGQEKKTGKNISFISHQNPSFFLHEYGEINQKKFINDLQQQLKELKKRSVDKTIDAVIFGGNYLTLINSISPNLKSDYYKNDYIQSIKLLSDEITRILNFEPMVMTGPKTGDRVYKRGDDIFYNNEHRRLYIMRPEVGKGSTEGFFPSNTDSQKEKWEYKV